MKHRKKLLDVCNNIKKTLSGVAGLSLLETTLALSVTAFIVISFSLVFANNYKSLNSSGEKSSTNYSYQSSMESSIAQGGPGTSENLTMTLTDGSDPLQISIAGLRATAGTLTSFLPGGAVDTTPVIGVSLAPDTLTLTEGGGGGSLTATVSPPNATNKNVTWTISDTQVATVTGSSQTAAVSPVSPGSAVITVTTVDGGFTAACEVTVSADSDVHATGVTVSPTSKSIKKKKTTTLTATVLPENATNKSVTWSSNDTGIATVDVNGVVTAKNTTGSCVIKVTTVDGGFTAECSITVTN